MTLAALIFDVDGTLAETEEAHRQSFNQSFAAAGLAWSWSVDQYRRLLATTGGKERIAAYQADRSDKLDASAIAELHRDKTARYARIVETGGLTLRPGVAELIAQARVSDLRLAVATTTTFANVDALCRACWGRAATQVFDVIAAGDEVAAKKPAPDVYQLALSRLGLDASQCLAFEDSLNGFRAAQAAGLAVVVTPSRYTAHEAFPAIADVRASLASYDLLNPT